MVWVLLKAFEPTALLVHPVNASFALNIVAAYNSAADGTWELALACSRSRPVPQIMILVLPAITLIPYPHFKSAVYVHIFPWSLQ